MTFPRSTDISTEQNNRMMERHFLLIGEEFFELLVGFIRGFGFQDTHAIHHAMDMCIDANKRQIIEMREDDFRGFDSDSGECTDGFHRLWNISMMFFDKLPRSHKEVFCFHSIIVYPSEHDLDLFRFEFQEICRRLHGFKEFLCCFIDSLIGHLC